MQKEGTGFKRFQGRTSGGRERVEGLILLWVQAKYHRQPAVLTRKKKGTGMLERPGDRISTTPMT